MDVTVEVIGLEIFQLTLHGYKYFILVHQTAGIGKQYSTLTAQYGSGFDLKSTRLLLWVLAQITSLPSPKVVGASPYEPRSGAA